MSQRLFVVLGGVAGGLWETIRVVVADSQWIFSVIIGAILSSIASIFVSEIYKAFKSYLKTKKELTQKYKK